MKRPLIIAAVAAAALGNAACLTVIDANSNYGWHGEGAQTYDSARDGCRNEASSGEGSTAFVQCMADKGWTRVRENSVVVTR